MKLSIKNLSVIPSLALEVELTRRFRKNMPAEDAQDFIASVQHEAAHVVAAISCGVHRIRLVHVSCNKRPICGASGEVFLAGYSPQHEAFISFAGFVWEKYNRDISRAESDLRRAVYETSLAEQDPMTEYRKAELLVIMDAAQAVTRATIGILTLADARGHLQGSRLRHLVEWLKPQVPHYATLG